MDGAFFAYLSRMRYINRWGLMRNSFTENVQEHSHMVAVIAHALAVIRRDIYGKPADPDKTAAAALFHDASEILTGDLPTPVKYNNPEISAAYKAVEEVACRRLLDYLPEEMRAAYEPLLGAKPEDEGYELVKAADKLAAYIKCVEEQKAGNNEFRLAGEQTLKSLENCGLEEVGYFMENFMPAFGLTLDELE